MDNADTLGRVERPQSEADWLPYVGELVQLDTRGVRGANGVGKFPGARLLEVRSNAALVKPPGHRRTEWVPLERVYLWRKGMHQEAERMNKRNPNGAHPPRLPTEQPRTSDHCTLIYSPSHGAYLGGPVRSRTFSYSAAEAVDFPSLAQAKQCIGNYKHRGTRRAEFSHAVEYRSRLEARELEAKTAADSKATQSLATSIIDKALGRAPEPAPAAVAATPPPPAPAPVPAEAAAPMSCAECFATYAKAMTDEADAEALLLQVRGERIKAQARLAVDHERRRLGLA